LAPVAAGRIHSGFERAFVQCEVSKVEDWIEHKDEETIRRKNLMKKYGKEYVV